MQARIAGTASSNHDHEEAFFVADLGQVSRQHKQWLANLREVKPYYAIKCNPAPETLRFLASLGVGFDCASQSEIQQVLDIGVDPSRIIYANPCKSESHLRYATRENISITTFDNEDELKKINAVNPNMELLLRIAIDDRSARCPLSSKFGAPLSATRGLLEKARELDLKVSGVAFHVGSGAEDVSTYVQGLRDARVVFDQAAELGFNFNTLDIGGGFSAGSFTDMSPVIIKALDLYFPASPRRPKFIAEPGRFYVENAFTLACQVIARSRAFHTQQETYKLILNDGVYGNLSGIIFDHQNPIPYVLQKGSTFLYGQMQCALHKSSMVRYSLWGPTCDGLDKITEECYFSHVLDIGDWLYFENMGAYTSCSATRFNSFRSNHDVIYANTERLLNEEAGENVLR